MSKLEEYFKQEGIVPLSEEEIQDFRDRLLTWYDDHQRDLPWRKTKDPYKIWVSEIMLQQTQVQTVIPYWERFIECLPDVESLANYPEDQVLKLWEGLGYYSRVKNMQKAAQQIMEDYDGHFPDHYDQLLKLQGIGPYTAGAIASIAFSEPVAAVDGNAMRVFSRLFEIPADISKEKTKRLFKELIEKLIDPDRPGDFNQAIMDIGARISMPKQYLADADPLKVYNQSYAKGTWMDYPVKKKAPKQKEEFYIACLLQNPQGEWLIQQRPKEGLLADMWTFPLIDMKELLGKDWKPLPSKQAPRLDEQSQDEVEEKIKSKIDSPTRVHIENEPLGQLRHVFSHRIWNINCYGGYLEGETRVSDATWVAEEDFDKYTFPGPQQKMLTLIPNKD